MARCQMKNSVEHFITVHTRRLQCGLEPQNRHSFGNFLYIFRKLCVFCYQISIFPKGTCNGHLKSLDKKDFNKVKIII